MKIAFGKYLVALFINFLIMFPFMIKFQIPDFRFFFVALFPFFILYSLSMIIGFCSFWIGNTRPLEFVMDKIMFLLSGVIIPIEFFPSWFRKLPNSLPFKYAAQIPTKALLGQINYVEIIIGILWVMSLMIFAIYLEKKGVKKYEMAGG